MSFGRLGREGGTRPFSEINMIPLIDVMLVLLVIFIITAPLLAPALRIELPQAAGATPPAAPPAVLRVAIDRDGRLHLDDAAIDAGQLAARLAEAAQRDPRTELQLRADRDAAYGHVAALIDLAQRAGLGRIAFVTAPPAPSMSPEPPEPR